MHQCLRGDGRPCRGAIVRRDDHPMTLKAVTRSALGLKGSAGKVTALERRRKRINCSGFVQVNAQDWISPNSSAIQPILLESINKMFRLHISSLGLFDVLDGDWRRRLHYDRGPTTDPWIIESLIPTTREIAAEPIVAWPLLWTHIGVSVPNRKESVLARFL